MQVVSVLSWAEKHLLLLKIVPSILVQKLQSPEKAPERTIEVVSPRKQSEAAAANPAWLAALRCHKNEVLYILRPEEEGERERLQPLKGAVFGHGGSYLDEDGVEHTGDDTRDERAFRAFRELAAALCFQGAGRRVLELTGDNEGYGVIIAMARAFEYVAARTGWAVNKDGRCIKLTKSGEGAA